MEVDFDLRVIDRHLEDSAIGLKTGDPQRFRLFHYPGDRPLEGVSINRTLDVNQQADLPLGTGVSGFLVEPDVQLRAR